MIKLKVSSNGAIYPNRGINVGMKYDNTNETIEFVLPEALETYNKYVVYSNFKGTFLAPLVDNTWTIRSNITNYPGTVKCLFLLSEAELDPNHFEIDNVATFLKVSGEFQINVANHFLKPEQVAPEEESPEFQVLFNHMMTLYNFFEEAKENDYYRGPQGPSTIAVGSTTSGLPTDNATVINVGSEQDAILNFRIPRGAPGSTPIKGIDYNTHEDGRFLLKDQGLGAHLQYKIDGVITNNGIFPSKDAAVEEYNEMYEEIEEDIGLYDHLYLANNFGNSTEPLETVVLEGVTWYNTYTWKAGTYLGGTGDTIQIGSNANPIRYFEHLSASSFTNVTKIQIKLSRAAAATAATYSIYIGNTPIVEDASIPTSREEFQVYEFEALSGPIKLVFNHSQSGALYLGTLQIFATQIYEFDRAQWHWAQIQTEDDSNRYAVWVSTDENDEIQIFGINEPTKIRALVNETEQNILNAPFKNIKYNAYWMAKQLFEHDLRSLPVFFSQTIPEKLKISYRCYHYSLDFEFDYIPNDTSGTIILQDKTTGDVINTFQLSAGPNTFHIDWYDRNDEDSDLVTLKISLNSGNIYTLNSNHTSHDSHYFWWIPDIYNNPDGYTGEAVKHPIVTNFILY